MHAFTLVTLCMLGVFAEGVAEAAVISFDSGYQDIASYTIQGELVWDSSWTFNGQPTSATNYPSEYDLELSAVITLFTPLAQSNILYLDVSNVVGTNFGSTFGAVFTDLTITGISLQGAFPFSMQFTNSGNDAVPGEELIGTESGSCGDSTTVPLTSTPGWTSTSQPEGVVLQTASGATDGLTGPWGCVYGDFRIQGGAVFALAFDVSTNLLDLDPSDLTLSVTYGFDYQSIAGMLQPQSSTPEPPTLILLGAVLLLGAKKWAELHHNR